MKEVQIEKHKNNTVSKANELIKAQGTLSSTAYKMLSSVISMLRTDDSEFQEYALKRDEYLNLINSKSNNDEFLYTQAEELMNNPFRVDGKLFNWCSMVDFKRIPGYIIFDVHPKLKPYLLELKKRGNFTQYKIVNILSLRGDYSPRMYELITMEWNQYKKYHKDAKSYTFELKIDFLRETFNIPSSYRYNDIKRNIIEKSKKQFKEKTDIQISYKEQKIGRRVDRLIITVKDNDKGSNDFLSDLQSFIKYMRKNYINQDVWKGQGMILSIAENGRIYNKKTLGEYGKKDALKVWENWYELAKNNQLLCLKQGKLF